MVQAELLSIFESLRKTVNELTSKISTPKISKNFESFAIPKDLEIFIFWLNFAKKSQKISIYIRELLLLRSSHAKQLLQRRHFGLFPEYFRFDPNQFRSVPVLSSLKHHAFSYELNECKLSKQSYAQTDSTLKYFGSGLQCL